MVERKSIVMDAELAKEIAALLAKSVAELKPAKHIVLTKWLTALGGVTLVSVWATFNTVVARWNAIPVVEARTQQAVLDIEAARDSLAEHKSQQAVETTKLTMQLDAIAQKQIEQKDALAEIGRKLDRLNGRPVVNPNP